MIPKKKAAGLIILAGGESRRMGRDKALLPLSGETMVRRVIRRLSPLGEGEVLISSNHPKKFQDLEIPVIPDQVRGVGPLAGIHACLHVSSCDLNLVTACDLPFVSGEVAQYLLKVAQSASWDVIVPMTGGRVHPLFGVYHSRILERLEGFLERGDRRVLHFLKEVQTCYVSGEFPPSAFFNMNRPEEYRWAMEWESRESQR